MIFIQRLSGTFVDKKSDAKAPLPQSYSTNTSMMSKTARIMIAIVFRIFVIICHRLIYMGRWVWRTYTNVLASLAKNTVYSSHSLTSIQTNNAITLKTILTQCTDFVKTQTTYHFVKEKNE